MLVRNSRWYSRLIFATSIVLDRESQVGFLKASRGGIAIMFRLDPGHPPDRLCLPESFNHFVNLQVGLEIRTSEGDGYARIPEFRQLVMDHEIANRLGEIPGYCRTGAPGKEHHDGQQHRGRPGEIRHGDTSF